MNNAPEKLYFKWQFNGQIDGSSTFIRCGFSSHDTVEYVRADLVPQWQPISTQPKDGREVLVYRPLAHLTSDPHVRVARTSQYDNTVRDVTIPKGYDSTNYFSDASCKATHWMPLPKAPT